MKLVVDMNLSVEWVWALKEAGLDAVHWSTVGAPDAGDDDIMAWARGSEAVVLTRDLDFGTMLTTEGLASPSVIQLRVDRARPERHLYLVQRALLLHRDGLVQGAIVTLQEDRVRVRVLEPEDPL